MFSWSWIAGLSGLTGIIALGVIAVVGGPIVPTLAKFADAIFTPIAGVLGTFFASILKMELDGTVDILGSGQRILAVVTFGVCVHSWAVHQTWQEVHASYTLSQKHTVTTPFIRHRR